MLAERAARDASRLIGAQAVVALVSVSLSAWLLRKVPREELALWPVTLGLGSFVAALASFGMGDIFVRAIPRLIARRRIRHARALLRTGLVLNVVGCALAAAGVYGAAAYISRYLLGGKVGPEVVKMVSFAAFFLAMRERIAWALKAVQEFDKLALLKVAVEVGRMPAIVTGFALLGLKGLVLGITAVPFVATVLGIWWLRVYLSGPGGFLHPRSLVKLVPWYYGGSLLSLASGRVRYLLIGALGNPAALSAYFAAMKLANYLDYVSRYAIAATAPKIAESAAAGQMQAEVAIRKCTRYAFLLLLPLHVMVIVAAGPAMRLFGGRQYAEAGPILMLLAGGLFMNALYSLYRTGVQVLGEPRHLLAIVGATAFLDLSTLVPLTIAYGAVGAAGAFIIRFTLSAVWAWLLLRRSITVRIDRQALGAGLWTSVLVAVGGACVYWVMPRADHKLLLLLIGGGTAVGLVAGLRGHLRFADVRLLTAWLPSGLRSGRVRQGAEELLCRMFAVEPRPAEVAKVSGTGA